MSQINLNKKLIHFAIIAIKIEITVQEKIPTIKINPKNKIPAIIYPNIEISIKSFPASII